MAMNPPRPHAVALVLAATAAGALLFAASPAWPAGPPPSDPAGGAPQAPSGFPPGMLGTLLAAEVAALRGEEADAERAARHYVDAARRHGDPALARRAARLAARAGRFGLAADAAEEWRRLDPESRRAPWMRALMLARADRVEEAAAELRSIAKGRDGDEAGHGDEYERIGFEAVVDILRLAPDRRRRVRIMEAVADARPESRYALAQVLAGAGEVERALRVLETLRRERPADDRYAVTHARLLHGRGDRDAALDALSGYGDGGSDELLRTHARLLAAAGRGEEARDRYAALLARSPDDHEARWELGRLLATTERLEDARAHFRALYRWPEWRDGAWYFTGLIDETLAGPDQALRAYRRVREGAWYVNARIRAAEIMSETGDVQWARWHLAATPRHAESDDVRLYRAESGLLLRADRPEEAMAVLDTALDAYPEEADLLYARAMAAERIDRLDILERDLRAIIDRDPNHAEALNALGYTLADRTNRYQEALELVERALALGPDEYHIVDSMGWVLYRLGRHEEAAEHLRRSYQGERDPVVAAHLGEVLWALGRRDEAREVWDSALEEAPDNEVLLETIERFGS